MANFKYQAHNFIVNQIKKLPPSQALRFLFRIDQILYNVQSQFALAYGNGIHPKHRHMRYHDFFINRIQANERVLDVGCHNGSVAYDIAEQAKAHVIGIELDPYNILDALQRHIHPRIQYCVGDVLTCLLIGHFDVVILSNVLEHLVGRPEFLRRLQTATHPTRILIRVPTFERDWRVPLKQELNVEWRLDLTHEIEYTLESFSEEMEAAGLEITYQEVRWGEIWAETRPMAQPNLNNYTS